MKKTGFTISFLILLLILYGCGRTTKKEYWPNGAVKSEIHLKGKSYEGKATWWYENGNRQMECFYTHNLLDSSLTRWYEDGKTQEKYRYGNNKKDGEFTVWDRSGKLSTRGYYQKGLLHGSFQSYYPSGVVKIEGHYNLGNFDGKWLYYNVFEEIIGRGDFQNGSGVQKAFFENGMLKSVTNYKNNVKEGTEQIYDSSGKIFETKIYKEGDLIR